MATPLPARALQRPLVGFGLTTAALVVLVTGGTGLLLSQGARQLQPPAPRAVAPGAPSAPSAPVVVRRAPGSVALPPPSAGSVALGPVAPVVDLAVPEVAPAVPPTEQAPADQPPVAEPPAAEPPAAEPPVVEPPVAEPPAEQPPAVAPEERPGRQQRTPQARSADGPGQDRRGAQPDDRGRHLGQHKH